MLTTYFSVVQLPILQVSNSLLKRAAVPSHVEISERATQHLFQFSTGPKEETWSDGGIYASQGPHHCRKRRSDPEQSVSIHSCVFSSISRVFEALFKHLRNPCAGLVVETAALLRPAGSGVALHPGRFPGSA